jgi:lysophospholipase L1-like esterase
MSRWNWVWIGLVAAVAAPSLRLATPSLASAGTYVLGDSIGDGFATTMGLNNLAQIGIHIRGPKALAQIARTPPGSTVYIFLGTNDAEGSIKNIGKSVDDILAAAAQRQLTVVWVGPHCVRKGWDAQAKQLDDILRTQLAKASVKYISTRDAGICSGKFHEPDGVHLTAKGYRYMSAMIDGAGAPPTRVASAAGDANFTTASVAPRPAPPAPRVADAGHRMVMEIHVPGAPSDPLVWTRSQN